LKSTLEIAAGLWFTVRSAGALSRAVKAINDRHRQLKEGNARDRSRIPILQPGAIAKKYKGSFAASASRRRSLLLAQVLLTKELQKGKKLTGAHPEEIFAETLDTTRTGFTPCLCTTCNPEEKSTAEEQKRKSARVALFTTENWKDVNDNLASFKTVAATAADRERTEQSGEVSNTNGGMSSGAIREAAEKLFAGVDGEAPRVRAKGGGGEPSARANGSGGEPGTRANGSGGEPGARANGIGGEPCARAIGSGGEPCARANGSGENPAPEPMGVADCLAWNPCTASRSSR
jgi:hypothetical protein